MERPEYLEHNMDYHEEKQEFAFQKTPSLYGELVVDNNNFTNAPIHMAISEKGLLRTFGEITKDFYNSNPLNRCFTWEAEHGMSAKHLFKYLIEQ